MIEVIEVLGQLLAILLAGIVGTSLVVVYVYIRTIDGLLTGNGWLARAITRLTK